MTDLVKVPKFNECDKSFESSDMWTNIYTHTCMHTRTHARMHADVHTRYFHRPFTLCISCKKYTFYFLLMVSRAMFL